MPLSGAQFLYRVINPEPHLTQNKRTSYTPFPLSSMYAGTETPLKRFFFCGRPELKAGASRSAARNQGKGEAPGAHTRFRAWPPSPRATGAATGPDPLRGLARPSSPTCPPRVSQHRGPDPRTLAIQGPDAGARVEGLLRALRKRQTWRAPRA